jgi:hypothetical protein
MNAGCRQLWNKEEWRMHTIVEERGMEDPDSCGIKRNGG